MSKSTSRLHQTIGDYMRLIENIKKTAKNKDELSKTKVNVIKSFRKKIVKISNQLHKGW